MPLITGKLDRMLLALEEQDKKAELEDLKEVSGRRLRMPPIWNGGVKRPLPMQKSAMSS